jgi:hypothetical protein
MTVKVGNIVIYVSPDGLDNWVPLEPDKVPAWLQKPDTLGAMLEGLLAHNGDVPDSPWYAAVTVPMPGETRPPAQAHVIDLRKPRLVLPKEMALLPSGVAMSEEVALDDALAEAGITRAQILGDGGNPVPMHPAFEGGGGQADGGGATASFDTPPEPDPTPTADASPSSSDPTPSDAGAP